MILNALRLCILLVTWSFYVIVWANINFGLYVHFVRLFVPFHFTNATLPEVISLIAFLCGRMIDHVFPPFDLAIFVGLGVMTI